MHKVFGKCENVGAVNENRNGKRERLTQSNNLVSEFLCEDGKTSVLLLDQRYWS